MDRTRRRAFLLAALLVTTTVALSPVWGGWLLYAYAVRLGSPMPPAPTGTPVSSEVANAIWASAREPFPIRVEPMGLRDIGSLFHLSEWRRHAGVSATVLVAKRSYFLTHPGVRGLDAGLGQTGTMAWISRHWSADEIERSIADESYFGVGDTGVQASAKRWFDLAPASLTATQAAFLFALPRSPSLACNPEKVLPERDAILERMNRGGVLDDASYAAATSSPAPAAPAACASPRQP